VTKVAHDHPHHEHDHAHAEEPVNAVQGESFDAANQALVDALRLSFKVLKLVMVFAVVLYLFSGLFVVERDKKVAVELRFGEQIALHREGVHWAWPYPIGEVIDVPVSTEKLEIDAFWIRLSDEQKTIPRSELMARGEGLEPGVDGALLTGDRGIMHLVARVQYRISDAQQYVTNVALRDDDRTAEKHLLNAVLKNACVATAGRSTTEIISKDPSDVMDEAKLRAQQTLDRLNTGITLTTVDVESWYPLQVQPMVNLVSNAMTAKEQARQTALAEQRKKLNEAAGKAWEPLWNAIQELDLTPDGPERDKVLARIDELLLGKDVAGKAGTRIQEARRQREQIVLSTLARQKTFLALLDQHRRNPQLLRQRLLFDGLKDLFAQTGVTKWMLPPGQNKQLDIWLNPDPVEFKKAQEEAMRQKTGAGAGK
jgi:regulator of protease activity HflC (stomatin/prohibitin superfamily)